MALETFQGFKRAADEGAVSLEGDTLAHVQKAVLTIAFDILDFCDEHGIDCVLVGGSCLGAVRHQGMIPWDDDVDLAMARADFDRFCALFPESALAERYQLAVPGETPDHLILLAQVRAKGTAFRGRDDLGEDCGIPVDIFVIENVPDNPALRGLHGFMCLGLGFLQSARKFAEYPEHYRSLAGDDAALQKAVDTKVRIGNLLRFKPLQWWTQKASNMYARSQNHSSALASIPSGRRHYFGETQPRAVFFPTSTAPYEGREVALPHDAHAYLKRIYGPDYMVVPEETDREKHMVLELDFGKGAEESA